MADESASSDSQAWLGSAERLGMSRAWIEANARFEAAFNARDPDSVVDLLSPDFHIDATAMAVTGHNRTFSGAAGLREWVADTFAPFDEESRYEIVYIVAVGEDFVVKSERIVGHGARSGRTARTAVDQRFVGDPGRKVRPFCGLCQSPRSPRSRGAHMNGRLSRGSVHPARRWVEGRGMVAQATPGAPRAEVPA